MSFGLPPSALKTELRFLPPLLRDPVVYWNVNHFLQAVIGLIELTALVMACLRSKTKQGKIALAIAGPAMMLWFLFAVVAETILSHADY